MKPHSVMMLFPALTPTSQPSPLRGERAENRNAQRHCTEPSFPTAPGTSQQLILEDKKGSGLRPPPCLPACGFVPLSPLARPFWNEQRTAEVSDRCQGASSGIFSAATQAPSGFHRAPVQCLEQACRYLSVLQRGGWKSRSGLPEQ